ncbi:MAG TPA: RuvA C-terminal domain-containing protein, partial [Polyangiaceae bacterium]
LVLELRERLPRVSDAKPATLAAAARGTATGDEGRLLGALTNMGYRLPDAERAVRALGDRVGRESLGELLKEALLGLAP